MTGNDARGDGHDDRHDDRHDALDALLRHSIRTAPMAEPPPGFAQAMEARVLVPSEQASVEVWLTRIAAGLLVLVLILTTAALASAHAGRIANALAQGLGEAPWPLLLTAMGILAVVKLVDLVPALGQRSR